MRVISHCFRISPLWPAAYNILIVASGGRKDQPGYFIWGMPIKVQRHYLGQRSLFGQVPGNATVCGVAYRAL